MIFIHTFIVQFILSFKNNKNKIKLENKTSNWILIQNCSMLTINLVIHNFNR